MDGMTGYVGARPLLAGLKPASDSGKMVTKDLPVVGILNSSCFRCCLLPWKEDGLSQQLHVKPWSFWTSLAQGFVVEPQTYWWCLQCGVNCNNCAREQPWELL